MQLLNNPKLTRPTDNLQAKANAEAVKRFGMHYQWGRKDPFTPAMSTIAWNNNPEVQIYKADGNTITKGTSGIATSSKQSEFKLEDKVKTTINDLIQNPSTHYTKGDGTNQVPIAITEYYNTNKEGDWWNPTIKTIYDPCPNGYRIPESGTFGEGGSVTTHPDWSEWLGSGLTAGRTFKNTSFFSTSSYRSNGMLGDVGSLGYSWMSTPSSSTSGYHLQFSSGTIIPNNSHNRSSGFATRCIKE